MDLDHAPDVLALFDLSIQAAGVAGEQRNARVLYLALTSRLLARPVSVLVKGSSSGGKSFLVDRVLAHFPEQAALKLTGMSEKSLVYLGDDVSHRHIVLAEAAGAAGRLRNYFIRTLLSEGHISWHTVERKRDGSVSRIIQKKGPTGLILTTTRLGEDVETETRLLTLTTNETAEQTRRVMQAVAQGQGGPGEGKLAVDPAWPAFQTALASGERRVVVPYAAALADVCATAMVRMRRDFSCLLSLIEAHALLHRETRGRDAEGRIVAEIRDYDEVRRHVADLMAEALEASVPRLMRQTVEVVRSISNEYDRSVRVVARMLRIHPSVASRRCQAAVRAGYVVSRHDKVKRCHVLDLGYPMPNDIEVLPPEVPSAHVVHTHEIAQNSGKIAENAAV